jgi:hypothetical protein
MELIVERCAGIDVGQAEVVVCARVPDAVTGRAGELVATYGCGSRRAVVVNDQSVAEPPASTSPTSKAS